MMSDYEKSMAYTKELIMNFGTPKYSSARNEVW